MNDKPLNICQVYVELNRLFHLAAKAEHFEAENRSLRARLGVSATPEPDARTTRPISETDIALAADLRAVLAERDRLTALCHATYTAMSESPIPQPPPDCDLAGWIRYALAAWRSEREEARHLADLCQGAHNTLTALGAMPKGTPAERIRAFYAAVHAAFSAQLHEANDARTRLADNADWVIRALAHANKLGAKDTWHQDAARVIREFSAVLSRLTEAENEIDDCCRILHVSGDRDLRAVVTDLMRELEERRCAIIRTERPADTEGAGWQHIVYRPEELSGWTADSEKSTQGEHPATPTVEPAGEALPPLAEARIEAMARTIGELSARLDAVEKKS